MCFSHITNHFKMKIPRRVEAIALQRAGQFFVPEHAFCWLRLDCCTRPLPFLVGKAELKFLLESFTHTQTIGQMQCVWAERSPPTVVRHQEEVSGVFPVEHAGPRRNTQCQGRGRKKCVLASHVLWENCRSSRQDLGHSTEKLTPLPTRRAITISTLTMPYHMITLRYTLPQKMVKIHTRAQLIKIGHREVK